MNKRKIAGGIYSLAAVDWDRRLFDSLVPLPDGTSYNAYLIEGAQKVALLDTVDPPMADTLLGQLAEVPKIDYIVVPPRRTGPFGLHRPGARQIPRRQSGSYARAKDMLIDLLRIPEEAFLTVEDGERLGSEARPSSSSILLGPLAGDYGHLP